MATAQDLINAAGATAATKLTADAAAVAADSADVSAQSALVSFLVTNGPVAVLSSDSSSITEFSAIAGAALPTTVVIPIASFVTVPSPTPAPAPAPAS